MHCRKYKETDFTSIIQMHALRDLPYPNSNELPQIGCIIKENDTPIVAAFLRRVEGGYAQIDTLISNPNVDKSLRDIAIDKCLKLLVNCAKTLKLRGLVSFCEVPASITRAEKHGFKQLNHKLMGISLK